jgi:hypothetical protein
VTSHTVGVFVCGAGSILVAYLGSFPLGYVTGAFFLGAGTIMAIVDHYLDL